MTIAYSDVKGIDFTLPNAPPLVNPPLDLLSLSGAPLIDLEKETADLEAAIERAASAQQQAADRESQGDTLSDADAGADAGETIESMRMSVRGAEQFASDQANRLRQLAAWEHGFLYLPELGNGELSLFAPGTTIDEANLDPTLTNLKPDADNQTPWAWYEPFEVIALDRRSTFGWPGTDLVARALRCERGLRAHRSWQCEEEFWGGAAVPTNYHLSSGSGTPTESPFITIDSFPDPEPAAGTILGQAVSLARGLCALEQSIADAEAGTGMIHASPFLVQAWMSVFPFIRDSNGKVYTVNHNLIVPGYGYPATGPDRDDREVTDGVTATDNTLSSATAEFTPFDVGRPVVGDGIAAGTLILAITSASEVTLTKATTASATGVTVTIKGTGGRATGSLTQWAYATEMTFTLRGDVHTRPAALAQMSPALNVDNDVPVRTEQSWSVVTNRLVRAAVAVNTGFS